METKPFEFRECVTLIKSTGKAVRSLGQFKDVLATVADESIVHHTSQYYMRSLGLEYTNDFAQWAGECLGDRGLAEHLSNVDSYAFRSIGDLRKELLRVIDAYLEHSPAPRDAGPGDEFFFNEGVTIVFPAGVRARNLAELLTGIKYVDANSIYYHFYEARRRLGGSVDDFSAWIEGSLGKPELAMHIRSIDPFMHIVEGIREHLVGDLEEELRKEMEEV